MHDASTEQHHSACSGPHCTYNLMLLIIEEGLSTPVTLPRQVVVYQSSDVWHAQGRVTVPSPYQDGARFLYLWHLENKKTNIFHFVSVLRESGKTKKQ